MLVNFVIVLTVLLGCCGLALDIGMLELKRLQMQNAADGAAMGAMMEGERGNADWAAAGRNDAVLNGFTDGAGGVSVQITNPPATGAYVNNNAAFQATVTQSNRALFMNSIIPVQAQATALIPPCAYFMTVGSSYAGIGEESAGMFARCPVYVAQNIYVDGFARLNTLALYVQGSVAGSAGSTGQISPAPLYGYPAMQDPLAYEVSPAYSGTCRFTALNVTTSQTLSPGNYCGTASAPGLTISNATVDFQPGLYTITGGLKVDAGTLNGSSVTLFMTKGGAAGYGQVHFGNNSQVNLSAPNAFYGDGTVPGILIFGDRSWTTNFKQDLQIESSSWTGDGIIYFLRGSVYEYNSNILASHYFGLVVDDVQEFFGTVHLSSDFAPLQGGNPFRPRESLAE